MNPNDLDPELDEFGIPVKHPQRCECPVCLAEYHERRRDEERDRRLMEDDDA